MQTMSLVSDDGPPVAARLFRPADGVRRCAAAS
jgi:hypothetical protein